MTNYGKQTETILKTYAKVKDDDNHVRMAKAELRFGIDYEMIQNPMDFFVRRTGRLYFDIESVTSLLEPILQEFQSVFKVDDAQTAAWRETLLALVKEHSDFSLERV